MSIIRIEKGPRMSQAVVHNGLIWLAGQIGHADSVRGQTEEALAAVEALLKKGGSAKSHILSVQIWLADMADFDEMNAVWDAWVDPKNPPARACGQVPLAAPEYRVEILVTAAQVAA